MACQAWEGKITEDKEDLNIRLIHSRFPRVTMKTNERKVLVTLTLLDLCFLGLVISVGLYCLYRYLKEQAELPKHNHSPEDLRGQVGKPGIIHPAVQTKKRAFEGLVFFCASDRQLGVWEKTPFPFPDRSEQVGEASA